MGDAGGSDGRGTTSNPSSAVFPGWDFEVPSRGAEHASGCVTLEDDLLFSVSASCCAGLADDLLLSGLGSSSVKLASSSSNGPYRTTWFLSLSSEPFFPLSPALPVFSSEALATLSFLPFAVRSSLLSDDMLLSLGVFSRLELSLSLFLLLLDDFLSPTSLPLLERREDCRFMLVDRLRLRLPPASL